MIYCNIYTYLKFSLNMSISTTLAGIKLNSCVFNAAGCHCENATQLDNLYHSAAGAVLSKTATYHSRKGNSGARLHIDHTNSINSMGLPNFGYMYYTKYGNKIIDKPYFQSIMPFSLDEMVSMLNDINKTVTDTRLVEINLSCPNVSHGVVVAYSYELLDTYLSCIDKLKIDNLIIGIKLPPYFQECDFRNISDIILKHNIKFITCINSIPNGLVIDIDKEETVISPRGGLGGLGGGCCKPIALSNVYQFYKKLGNKIDIVGCGGVCDGSDIFSHILCGATAVQVGTSIIKNGPSYFDVLNKQLFDIMKQKGYSSLVDFRGKLKLKKHIS